MSVEDSDNIPDLVRWRSRCRVKIEKLKRLQLEARKNVEQLEKSLASVYRDRLESLRRKEGNEC